MDFLDSFFEDEVRDGFYIPSMMKRAWAAQLEILEGIRKVCEKHNIQYFAEWGSLLGAIRHGGIIPWDDDLDICMKGKDYEKFLTVADELPEGNWVLDYHYSELNDNMVTRILNTRNSILGSEELVRYHGYPFAAGIDIFCLDYLPSDPEQKKEFRTIVKFLCLVIITLREENEAGRSANTDDMEALYQRVEKLCSVKLDRRQSLKTQLYDVLNKKVAHLYSESEANELTHLPKWSSNQDYWMPKECYADAVLVPFENTEIMVPAGYEQLLCRKYGNGYMKPIQAGSAHDYPFYEKQQKNSKEQAGIEFYQYSFSKDEMLQAEGEREQKETLRSRVFAFLPLFQEAHESILLLLKEGNSDSVAEILGDCQEAAIQLGTLIENEKGENSSTVAVLEKYCEDLFQIHSILPEGGSNSYEMAAHVFEHFEKQLPEHAEQELKERKEIVFLPYKVSYWKAMESVWQAAMDAPDTDVYVIPLPYYYKDAFGAVKDEEIYELDYPEEVTLTSYKEYNFQVHHPDTVVIQYPYDEYNYALSIHPFFYSKNIKKYTDKLVYIPPLVMKEIGPEDERARKTLKYFCNMPGVVNADKVIVQSEQMKKMYVELLTEFAGDDTKEIWENKIYGMGSPVSDYEHKIEKNDSDCPQDWLPVLKKTDGTWRKVVLYTTSASALLYHGDKMLDKMKQVIQAFREQQEDIALIWRPDSKARDMLRKRYPGLWQQYRELVTQYQEEAWGIYDESPDAECAITLCDACYGDGGIVFNACRTRKKVIMLQKAE